MPIQGRPPRIAVVGCGYWGKNLVRNFHELGHLYGLLDADHLHLQSFATQYPAAKIYRNWNDLLDDRELDAVAIATPAETHFKLGTAALTAGKDVFVEKPLALTPKEGMEMVERGRRYNRVLMVGHLLFYHPAVIVMQELLRAGELGALEYIYSNRVSMGKIRREENALWSFAPHDISIILNLVGHLPIQVTAVGGAYLQPNIADVTVSNLLFERGTRAHIFVSWLHPYKEQRLVVIGSKKMLVFEDSRPSDKLMLFDKQIALSKGVYEVTQPKGVSIEFPQGEPLRLECEHFIESVKSRQNPRTPGENGVDVLRVLHACQRSMQLNGETVQVDAAIRSAVISL
jgi:UDP-2-acetamido-3-amino-2,3-dideoxy-glucuronate N-acetyltransferase